MKSSSFGEKQRVRLFFSCVRGPLLTLANVLIKVWCLDKRGRDFLVSMSYG